MCIVCLNLLIVRFGVPEPRTFQDFDRTSVASNLAFKLTQKQEMLFEWFKAGKEQCNDNNKGVVGTHRCDGGIWKQCQGSRERCMYSLVKRTRLQPRNEAKGTR